MLILKILGFVLLAGLAFILAVGGAFGGIAMFYGKPSGDGSGAIVILALVAIAISLPLAALTAYRFMRRFSLRYRNVAFPALTLVFSLILGPLFVAALFASLGVH